MTLQPVRLRSSARTSIGQVRQNNEDNVQLWQGDHAVLAIVADGMGGAAAGEEASRMTVEAIEGKIITKEPILEKLNALDDEQVAHKLRQILRTANQEIMQRAADTPELRGMGTTATLAFVRDRQAVVAHVGDSRAYLVRRRDQAISQVTADHSFVEALVAAGHITQEQAENHPMQHVLYRALGQSEDIDVDVYYVRLHVGDWLVMCSDGLTRHVKPTEIADAALAADDPQTVTQQLIDLANARGGEDNVSVVAVYLEGDEPARDDRTLVLTSEEDTETLILTNTVTKLHAADEPDTLPARPNHQSKDDTATQEADRIDETITKRANLRASANDEGRDNLSPEE